MCGLSSIPAAALCLLAFILRQDPLNYEVRREDMICNVEVALRQPAFEQILASYQKEVLSKEECTDDLLVARQIAN